MHSHEKCPSAIWYTGQTSWVDTAVDRAGQDMQHGTGSQHKEPPPMNAQYMFCERTQVRTRGGSLHPSRPTASSLQPPTEEDLLGPATL